MHEIQWGWLPRWVRELLDLELPHHHHSHPRRPVRLKLHFDHHGHRYSQVIVKGHRVMQIIAKQGTKVTVSAVDKDGLDIAVPQPASWSIAAGAFAIQVADDTLSAVITPNGDTTTGSLVVTAGGLSVSVDLSYTNSAPEQREPVKLNLTFTDLPVPDPTAAPAPAPAPAPDQPAPAPAPDLPLP